jgi:hypothetical protein
MLDRTGDAITLCHPGAGERGLPWTEAAAELLIRHRAWRFREDFSESLRILSTDSAARF